MNYDWDNPKKVNNSNNPILNKIGNFSEFIARPLMFMYYKWGTFNELIEIDFQEEVDKDLNG